MKRNDIKALHDKTVGELNKMLAEMLDNLAKIRLEKGAGRLENTSSVKMLADDVARVKTILTIKTASAVKIEAENNVSANKKSEEKKEKADK